MKQTLFWPTLALTALTVFAQQQPTPRPQQPQPGTPQTGRQQAAQQQLSQQRDLPEGVMCLALGIVVPCEQAQDVVARGGNRLVDSPSARTRRVGRDTTLDDELTEILGGTTVGAVYRADTMTPLRGVRVEPKPLGIPTGFDKPCKAQTVTDVSERRSVVTDERGVYTLSWSPPTSVDPNIPIVFDDATRHLLEMEQMRRLAERGVTAASSDRIANERLPQALLNLATAAGPVPLGRRTLVDSEITAEHEGYVEIPSKFLRPDVIGMVPAPTISGRVLGPAGVPIAGAVVQAYSVEFRPLGRTIKWVKSTLTNDLGEYRLSWLPYGWYYIAAGQSSYALQPWMDGLRLTPNMPDPDQGMPLQFFPGVENAVDAKLVHVKAPTPESPSTPTPTALLNVKERPRFNVKVELTAESVPADATFVFVAVGGDVCASMDYAIQRNSDGTFEVRDVPRGHYEMVALRGKDVISGLMQVNVDRNIDNLKLALVPPVTVNGTITFEGLPPGVNPQVVLGDLRVNLTRAHSEVSRVATTVADPKTLNFAIEGLGPGLYYPTLELPPGAYVKDIRVMKPDPAPAGTPSDNWACKVASMGIYAYLDSHGHINPLELPRSISTDNPNDPLCLNIVISFEGQIRGLGVEKRPPKPPSLPRMLVLMPRSAWQKWGDNGVTPPDRMPIVDASGGGEFFGIPFDNYKVFAVEYANADLIFRPEFVDWFNSYALTMRYETVAPCPGNDPVLCTVILPAQEIVDQVVP